VSGAVPSVPGVLLVWGAAGALTLVGALVLAELSSAFPRSGGVYVYLREAYSPAIAYMWGWAMFWVMHSGIIAAIGNVFGTYVGHFVPLDQTGTRLVGAGAIVALSAVNYVGVRHGSAVQTFFTVVKLVAVAAIIVAGAWFLVAHGFAVSRVPSAESRVTIGSFATATAAGLFAYGGWHMVTYASEETKDSMRTIPRALLIGAIVVTVAYIGVNAAYLAVLPLDTVAQSTRVAADFADAVTGSAIGGQALSILVILSSLGAMTGIILAGPRAYMAMAQDGLLFRWAAKLHPRYRTPHIAIALQGVWSVVLVLTGSYRALFTRVVYTEWVFFALVAASLFFLRRRAGYKPLYRVWGFPVLPGIFVLSSAAIVLHEIVKAPAESLTGLGLVAAGLPVYWIWTRLATPKSVN
ncbi:MAG TPA: amino acid permease, partial [Gemmatimonadaceae bacterium]